MPTLVIFPHWHFWLGQRGVIQIVYAQLRDCHSFYSQRKEASSPLALSFLPLYFIESFTTIENGSTEQPDHPSDPNHRALHPPQKHVKIEAIHKAGENRSARDTQVPHSSRIAAVTLCQGTRQRCWKPAEGLYSQPVSKG